MRLKNEIRDWLRRRTDAASADDITQKVVLRTIFRTRQKVEKEIEKRSFRRKAKDELYELRRHANTRVHLPWDEADADPVVEGLSPGERVDLVECLDRLPNHLKSAVDAYYYEGLDGDDFVKRVNLPETTAFDHRAAALVTLRRYLEGSNH